MSDGMKRDLSSFLLDCYQIKGQLGTKKVFLIWLSYCSSHFYVCLFRTQAHSKET